MEESDPVLSMYLTRWKASPRAEKRERLEAEAASRDKAVSEKCTLL
jgi:hypothetical protein